MTLLMNLEGTSSIPITLSESELKELNWGDHFLLRHSIVDGKLVIEAAKIPFYTSEQLLTGITPEIIGGEISTGYSVGEEL